METKISPHRTGEPRFGTRDPEPFDNSVKESHLSPEELEDYRNGKKGGSKFMTQEDYEKLLKQGMTKQQIADKFEISLQTLYNRIKAWKSKARKQQIKPDSDEKKDTKVNTALNENSSKIAEYERQIVELKEKLAKQENISAVCEDVENEIATLREDNDKLTNQVREYDVIIENQKYQLGKYAKQNTEQQEEIEHLKYFAHRYLAV